jgi:hypothetical protein
MSESEMTRLFGTPEQKAARDQRAIARGREIGPAALERKFAEERPTAYRLAQIGKGADVAAGRLTRGLLTDPMGLATLAREGPKAALEQQLGTANAALQVAGAPFSAASALVAPVTGESVLQEPPRGEPGSMERIRDIPRALMNMPTDLPMTVGRASRGVAEMVPGVTSVKGLPEAIEGAGTLVGGHAMMASFRTIPPEIANQKRIGSAPEAVPESRIVSPEEAAQIVRGRQVREAAASLEKTVAEPKPSLWREASAQEADQLVNPATMSASPFGIPERYVATDRSLALGQGRNRSGVTIEFDPEGLDVAAPQSTKPGAEFVEARGGGAERVLRGQDQSVGKNVRSISIAADSTPNIYTKRLTRSLEKQGWAKTVEDGATVYRKTAPAAAPVATDVPSAMLEAPPSAPKSAGVADQGVTLGSGLGALGEKPVKAAESLYDSADAALAAVGKKAGRAVSKAVGAGVQKLPFGAQEKVGEAVQTVREGVMTKGSAVSGEFGQQMRTMRAERDAAKSTAYESAVDLDKLLDDLPDADRFEVTRYMTSERGDLPAGAQHLKAQIDTTSRFIKSLTEQLVEAGELSPEAAAQYERYLPRLYASKMAESRAAGGVVRGAVRLKENFVREDAPGVYLRGDKADIAPVAEPLGGYAVTQKGKTTAVKFKTPEERQAFIDALSPQSKSTVRKFEPIAPEVQESLGRIMEPGAGVLHAIWNAMDRLAVRKFLDNVKTYSDAKGPAWSETPIPGYVEVTAPGLRALKPGFIRPDIQGALAGDFVSTSRPGLWGGLLDSFKENKTVMNAPRGAMRQVFGNVFFQKLAGVDPMNPANATHYVEAVRAMRGKSEFAGEGPLKALLGEADFSAHELRNVEAYLTHGADGPKFSYQLGRFLGAPWQVIPGFKPTRAALSKFYSFSDRMTKAAAYIKNRRAGMTPEQAGADVHLYTQDYRNVGPWIDWARKSIVGSPFLAFKAETYRNVANAAKSHPLRLANAVATIYGMKELAQLVVGTSKEEDEALAQERGSLEIPAGRDAKGNVTSFDTRYIYPLGEQLVPEVRDLDENTLRWLSGFIGVDQGPGYQLSSMGIPLVTGGTGQDRNGRDLWKPGSGVGEKLTGFAKGYGEMMAPPPLPGLGSTARQINASLKGEQISPRVPRQTPTQAVVSAIIGLGVRPLDLALERKNLIQQRNKFISGRTGEDRLRFLIEAKKRLDVLNRAAASRPFEMSGK